MLDILCKTLYTYKVRCNLLHKNLSVLREKRKGEKNGQKNGK